jgi:hypothetical protein
VPLPARLRKLQVRSLLLQDLSNSDRLSRQLYIHLQSISKQNKARERACKPRDTQAERLGPLQSRRWRCSCIQAWVNMIDDPHAKEVEEVRPQIATNGNRRRVFCPRQH